MTLRNTYHNYSDKELLSLIKDNPSIELKTILFQRYMDKIYGLCLKYLKQEEDAKDAMMSIYELFIRKIETHQVEYVNSWIYVVSKNYCFDLLRKEKRQFDKKDDYLSVQYDAEYHPYNEDEHENRLQELENCIELLIFDQRQVVQMFYNEKKSYQEISETLTLSWSKIRSLIQNARRNLKNCMEK